MSLFSQNLRFLRKQGHYNQDQIAVLFNKRPNTIGNWENQKSEPSLTELMRLAEFFRVSIQDILNADLEGQDDKRIYNNVVESPSVPNAVPETLPADARESGSDAFWMILKELRMVNEKLDKMKSTDSNSTYHIKSDKSSH